MGYHLLAPFCLLALLLPPLPLGAPMSTAESVKQAYNLALHMQTQTSTLLQTYLQHQSTPFSDPDFSLPELKLRTLPPTAMHFENWHGLEDAVRLSLTHEAFLSFSQHLLLAIVDQSNLNPDNSMVENQLWEERLKAKGLAGNLAGIMTALGLPTPPANPPLGTVPLGNTAFQKKCRGYVIVRDYGLWTDRVVTFLAPFCLLALLLPPLPLGAPMSTAESVKQAYNLALHLQRQTSTLLQTYLQHQGTPFSDPDFSLPELSLSTLPDTEMFFETWHGLEDEVRLSLIQEAFWSFSQHLRLVMLDQDDLNHGNSIVEDQLWKARLKAKSLAGNLADIMTALGVTTPPANTHLSNVPLGDTAFQKRCRGYVIIRDFGFWTDRAVTFLAPFCLLALLLPPLPLGAPMSTAESVKQAYNLALHMQTQTSTLLQTYLQHQGSPFSDPDFSMPELSLRTLPPTAMPFAIWHGLEDVVRLSLTHEAFWSFSQHLLLAIADQSDLSPGNSIVEDQLWEARLKAKGLTGNLAGIMTALGLPTPPLNIPLGTVPLGDTAFQKKCRGYVIIRDYGFWTDRAVTFLGHIHFRMTDGIPALGSPEAPIYSVAFADGWGHQAIPQGSYSP
ncbi:hypothetical protein MG293_018312 [Ovis ammon polii]|uniref:Uncharacterized protein n=1 Tax=Ovis ammon polii TaxID=230172 RepID=A0AAD4TP68_OVIAM|nr:hypothetical protein MG293_018312 [Ovis ammon polii]KAI4551622.1 hypothetical protein MJT46_017874 [Ovis ammon polii x Ovis aries]